MKNLSQYTTEELIRMFEDVRDELVLETKTKHSKRTKVVYNTVSNKIAKGELKHTEVDGTVYISNRKNQCTCCEGSGICDEIEACLTCGGSGLL